MRKLLIILVSVVAVLLVIDRVAVLVATRLLDSRVEQELGAPAGTSIGGFPFLTSAVRKTLPEVTLTADKVRLGGADLTVDSLRAELTDVHGSSPSNATAKTFDAHAVVPYSEVERRLDLPAGSLSGTEDGQLRLTLSTEVFGQRVEVVVTGHTEQVGDIVSVRPDKVPTSIAGLQLPEQVRQDLEERLRLRLPLEDLPRGTRLTDLQTRPEGLVLRLQGDDVPLAQL